MCQMVSSPRKQKHKYVLVKYQNAEMSLSTVAVLYSVQILYISKLMKERMTSI